MTQRRESRDYPDVFSVSIGLRARPSEHSTPNRIKGPMRPQLFFKR